MIEIMFPVSEDGDALGRGRAVRCHGIAVSVLGESWAAARLVLEAITVRGISANTRLVLPVSHLDEFIAGLDGIRNICARQARV